MALAWSGPVWSALVRSGLVCLPQRAEFCCVAAGEASQSHSNNPTDLTWVAGVQVAQNGTRAGVLTNGELHAVLEGRPLVYVEHRNGDGSCRRFRRKLAVGASIIRHLHPRVGIGVGLCQE